jgi:hypothetical protein
MEILENLFHEENEEIIDLVIDILDGQFGYDEDFFCDEEGYPNNSKKMFYSDALGGPCVDGSIYG